MDWELFGFLIFVVIYLVATISEKTKKHKEKAEKKTKQTVLPAFGDHVFHYVKICGNTDCRTAFVQNVIPIYRIDDNGIHH